MQRHDECREVGRHDAGIECAGRGGALPGEPRGERPWPGETAARTAAEHGHRHRQGQSRGERGKPALFVGDQVRCGRMAREPRHEVVADAKETVVPAGAREPDRGVGKTRILLVDERTNERFVHLDGRELAMAHRVLRTSHRG